MKRYRNKARLGYLSLAIYALMLQGCAPNSAPLMPEPLPCPTVKVDPNLPQTIPVNGLQRWEQHLRRLRLLSPSVTNAP